MTVEAGNDVYEVQSFPNVTVDIARGNCSCQSWQLERFPCVHAVAAICSAGKDLSSYVDPYYHVEAFRASYSFSIYPIPTVWMREQQDDEGFILPPVSKKPPGRPRTQRIPSRGENRNQIKCGRCQRLGNHNRKSCKEAV
jgi:zinc finger SWIM domain-containing protein 3